MTQPSALRHSKTHRAAITRQWSKQMVRYELLLRLKAIGLHHTDLASDIRDCINLPAGAIVRTQAFVDYGNSYGVVVDVPRSAHMVLHESIRVKCLGRVPAPKPGEAIVVADNRGLVRPAKCRPIEPTRWTQ